VTRVAVVAHSGKSIGGGLNELHKVLATKGVLQPDWYEVPKSRGAPNAVRKALEKKPDLLLAWGGDGMMQRTIDTMAGSETALGIVPAGTSNLLARNLGVPIDLERAIDVALGGKRRLLDIGRMNGEAFAVMAGAGFDAQMIADADGSLKERLGRIAYVWAGTKNLRSKPFDARIKVDGDDWYKGPATCVLLGNVGKLFGGLEAFEHARPDDGLLELGVVSAEGVLEWARTIARATTGNAEGSRFVEVTKARDVRITTSRKVRYELDGGARGKERKLRVKVQPRAVTVCVP
jgi:diacylglycerol kinase (ATP)